MISAVAVASFFRAALVGIFVFLSAWIGLEKTITPDGIAILWPANAVLLTALLQTPRNEWPLITLAALIAFSAAIFYFSFPLWSVALFSFVNIFEALLAALLIQLFTGKEFNIHSRRSIIVFFLAAPLVASSVAAMLGASIYETLARTENSLVVLWRLWWFSDALGLIIFTPLLMATWNTKISRNKVFDKKQLMILAELAAIWAGIAITGIFALHTARHGEIAFLLSPVLLLGLATWTAVRLNILATTFTVALIGALVIALLVQPTPFFNAVMSSQDAVWISQEYLLVISTIALVLSGFMEKFRRQRASLLLHDRAMLASNDAISIIDVQQTGMPVTWVNPKFEKLFGFSAEEIVGRNWHLVQEGTHQQNSLGTIRTALADKKPCRTQLQDYTKDGEPLWIDFSLAPVSNQAGQVTHFIAIYHDNTQAKETEERLKDATEALHRHNELLEEKVQERTASLEKANKELTQVASLDYLTGIANRRHFYELGQRELKRLRMDGLKASLIAFDLDNFKAINDTYGHEAGDQVLRQIITPVEKIIRPTDSFGRVGGDEFLILFTGTSESKAVEVAERIRTEISEILSSFGSANLGVTASFGVAEWDRKGDLTQLIRRADLALYHAKEKGRNSVCTWHPELDRHTENLEFLSTG